MRSASGALAAAATVIALLSAWHSGGHVWRLLDREHSSYAQLTSDQRRQEPVTQLEITGDIFDFYAAQIVKGDRVYFQVLPSGFSHDLDLPSAVASLGRFYLLPGVQTTNLADATVVVSYFEDPGLLHLHFIAQARAGVQLFFVSRIRTP